MLKNETSKLTDQVNSLNQDLAEWKQKASEASETANQLQLAANKTKMEWMFKDDKNRKEMGYANDKIGAL